MKLISLHQLRFLHHSFSRVDDIEHTGTGHPLRNNVPNPRGPSLLHPSTFLLWSRVFELAPLLTNFVKFFHKDTLPFFQTSINVRVEEQDSSIFVWFTPLPRILHGCFCYSHQLAFPTRGCSTGSTLSLLYRQLPREQWWVRRACQLLTWCSYECGAMHLQHRLY